MSGWIKLHRCLLDKTVWQCSTDAQKAVLITMLLMANHEPKKWLWKGKLYEVKSGQFVTSLRNLAQKSGTSVQTVRSSLEKFKTLEFATHESTRTGILVTIENWGVYQGDDREANTQSNTQPTHSQHTTNTQPTHSQQLTRTIKNYKELNNDKQLLHSVVELLNDNDWDFLNKHIDGLVDIIDEVDDTYPDKSSIRNARNLIVKVAKEKGVYL